MITLGTRWAVVWTTVAIMSGLPNTKPPATIDFPSPPLPFAFSLYELHSVTFENSAGRAVWTIGWSTVTIMLCKLHTEISDKIKKNTNLINNRSRAPDSQDSASNHCFVLNAHDCDLRTVENWVLDIPYSYLINKRSINSSLNFSIYWCRRDHCKYKSIITV